MKKQIERNFMSLAVHVMPGSVKGFGLDTVILRDSVGDLYACKRIHFVEAKAGLLYFAAGKLQYLGKEEIDPVSANLAWQPHIPIPEDLLSYMSRAYGLSPLAAPAGVSLTTDEGIAVTRTFMTAPDYAVALVWFYVFGCYNGDVLFADVMWEGEPGRSPLYIKHAGREACIVGLAREYVAFWWALSGGWGNEPRDFMPLPTRTKFRDQFRGLRPDPSRSKFLNQERYHGWEPREGMKLPKNSVYELHLPTHSIYFGRMSNELFPITYGASGLLQATPYPSDVVPWDRQTRVDCAVKFRVPRARLATVLGLPQLMV